VAWFQQYFLQLLRELLSHLFIVVRQNRIVFFYSESQETPVPAGEPALQIKEEYFLFDLERHSLAQLYLDGAS